MKLKLPKLKKRFKYGIAGLLIVFITSSAFYNPSEKYFEIAKNLDIFATLFKEVNTWYVDDVTPATLMKTGIDAMLASLDPYTNYISEDQIEDYRTMTTGEYSGIGASVGTRDGRILIMMPLEGFAADKAGIKIGDEIMAIDGISLADKTYDETSQLLKGQAKTDVVLSIKRYGNEKPIDITITREKIQTYNVPYYGMVTENIGMIKLTDFTRDASKEVNDALLALKAKGAEKIIFDVRGNPGGLLDEAVKISNIFVEKGKEIVSTKGKVKDWNKTYNGLSKATDTQIPLVVLTSGTSASAAEIVSGVIQDYDRGVLIGENTYGKGLVQATRSLSYNSKLKVTIAKYYIPSGRCIQAIDYAHRNEDGSVGKMADSLRMPFKTAAGRLVYDGGGVKPDITIDHDRFAPITQTLFLKGLLFDYANKYHFEHKTITEAKKFNLTDTEYNSFVKWLSAKEYDYTTKVEKMIKELEEVAQKEDSYDALKPKIDEFKKGIAHNKENDLRNHKTEIMELLEREIITRYYLERGQMEATFDDDLDLKAAIEVLNDEVRYKKILSVE
ncbi:C-terminal processing peptidase-3 [Bernardetia litoralis DSM 6794]|uniref:C-terminal processing peptidase-3 n=1 Tax=Bernardetia litoralis (strain ATCC 23117 / DSM 6794 / NBRC 15988 / NCIMB 1366 / Fx l1 / Sio-4) TaxID=880071 RepID=I4APU7_BERLS|nr:S41 family peptidase [Bernardetia litoralis]AFM05982.1 C-terminal processing peptidase-3 [Bernardetia litoralis DSM 6794]